jgi:hypothetical protein
MHEFKAGDKVKIHGCNFIDEITRTLFVDDEGDLCAEQGGWFCVMPEHWQPIEEEKTIEELIKNLEYYFGKDNIQLNMVLKKYRPTKSLTKQEAETKIKELSGEDVIIV